MRRVSYARRPRSPAILQRGRRRHRPLSQRASVIVDDRTNTLIIQELPAFMDQVISIIENLDIPEDQVMIEARIVETTKNWSRSLGFDWGFDGVADAAHGNTTGLDVPQQRSTRQTAAPACSPAAPTASSTSALGNILNTFELDVVPAGGRERGSGQRPLGAQGRHPQQRARRRSRAASRSRFRPSPTTRSPCSSSTRRCAST